MIFPLRPVDAVDNMNWFFNIDYIPISGLHIYFELKSDIQAQWILK